MLLYQCVCKVRTPFDEITNSLRFLLDSTDRHFFHQTNIFFIKQTNKKISRSKFSSRRPILFFFKKIFLSLFDRKSFSHESDHTTEHINAFESDEPPKEKAKESFEKNIFVLEEESR